MFELACKLAKDAGKAPVCLIVSGCRPPDVSVPDRYLHDGMPSSFGAVCSSKLPSFFSEVSLVANVVAGLTAVLTVAVVLVVVIIRT